MSDSDDSLNELLNDTFHKENSFVSSSDNNTKEKEMISPIESWLASSQSEEDKLVRQLSDKPSSQNEDEQNKKTKKQQKSPKRKPKIRKITLENSDDDFETPGALKPGEPIDGPDSEDVNKWNIAGHSDTYDFVWVNIKFKPTKEESKKKPIEDSEKEGDEKKEGGKGKKKKEKKKTKKELEKEKKKAEAAIRKAEEQASIKPEFQWWPGRVVNTAKERSWLRNENWVPSDFDYDKVKLVSLFDLKNSLVSVSKSKVRAFNYGDNKGGGKKKKNKTITKEEIMSRGWSSSLTSAMLDNAKDFNTTKKTIQKMLSRAKKWLKVSLLSEVERETGEFIEYEEEEIDEDDDEAKAKNSEFLRRLAESNNEPLQPETLQAGDIIRFHDRRFIFGKNSRREGTVMSILEGGLEAHKFPLKLSNGLDVLVEGDTYILKVNQSEVGNKKEEEKEEEDQDNDEKGPIAKKLKKQAEDDDKSCDEKEMNEQEDEKGDEKGGGGGGGGGEQSIDQASRWRKLSTFTIIEGAGDPSLQLQSDQSVLAAHMKQSNIEINAEMEQLHDKYILNSGELSEHESDDDDSEDDDSDD